MAMAKSHGSDNLLVEAAMKSDVTTLNGIRIEMTNIDFHKKCCSPIDNLENSIFHIVAAAGALDSCVFLVEAGICADLQNDKGDSPLMVAIKEDCRMTASYLISCSNVTLSNYLGMTALHYAVETENIELMELCLKKGSNIESQSVNGTPLHCAADGAKLESIKYLLSNQADPNAIRKQDGASPLFSAISSRSPPCVDLLLFAGANPNYRVCGTTPLIHAIEQSTNCIQSLIAAGAHPDAVNMFGWRALEHAAINRNVEALQILFSVTPRLFCYPDWSPNGILQSVQCGESRQEFETKWRTSIEQLKQLGDDCFERGDFCAAAERLSELIYHHPHYDEELFWRRSICWESLGEPELALSDAEECVRIRSDWAKGHYRLGCTWKLIENYKMAAEAYRKALDLTIEMYRNWS